MSDQDTTDTSAPSGASRSCNPTGGRRRDSSFYAALDRASSIPDLPDGTDRFTAIRLLRRQGLAARLGWSGRLVDHIELLVQATAPLDWEPGNLRITWRSVSQTAEDLGISEAQVRRSERRLMKLGAIAWQDSSNYRRHGKRSKKDGRILRGCGVDLAPLALLTADLQREASILDAELKAHRDLRERLSRARRHCRDALIQAVQDGRIPTPAADLLNAQLHDLQPSRPAVRIPLDDLCALCEAAEQFENALTDRLRAKPEPERESHDDSPIMPAQADPECLPITITKTNYVQEVVAADPSPPTSATATAAARPMAGKEGCSREDADRAAGRKGPPDWLILETLSPRIAQYLPVVGPPDARDFYDAANRARSQMGISPDAWAEACRLMTRVGAALAVVIIASRLDREEIASPGGYLRSLSKAAREGRLNMTRSLWGAVDRADRRQAAEDASPTSRLPDLEPGAAP